VNTRNVKVNTGDIEVNTGDINVGVSKGDMPRTFERREVLDGGFGGQWPGGRFLATRA
jgi:hypothetical protein